MPLIHAILGADAELVHFGCMLSFPGSAIQPWHSDGPHIRGCGEMGAEYVSMSGGGAAGAAAARMGGAGGKRPADAEEADQKDGGGDGGDDGGGVPGRHFIAPVHAINVFVPLVDLTTDKGPTEFVPGSHRDFDIGNPSTVVTAKAGQAILFDYRVKHRGLGNRSTDDRPLLYITYARPFWMDVYNFDKKRYQSLPKCEERGTREERMAKRQR